MLIGGNPEAIFVDRLQCLLDGAHTILDIGTSQRFAKELRPYESLFYGKKYVAAGYNPSMGYGKYNCDCHQDIDSMTFSDSSFDAVICLEALEHVRNQFQAAREVKRVLKEGGRLLLTAPFLTQYHAKGSASQAHDQYPDFWRFTHEGLQRLFDDLREVEITPLDGPIEFRLKQLYFNRLLRNPFIRKIVDTIDRPRIGKATSRHLLFGIK